MNNLQDTFSKGWVTLLIPGLKGAIRKPFELMVASLYPHHIGRLAITNLSCKSLSKNNIIFGGNTMQRQHLKLQDLFNEAIEFARLFELTSCPELAGITDGKAIGTFVEHRFKDYLAERYDNLEGNSAHGVDLSNPELNTDIKATYIKQPQSSCPYKDASQKIFGLGYNLIVFVYDRAEEDPNHPITLINVTFIEAKRTGDYTLTYRLREMIQDHASVEDIVAFFDDKGLPGDEITHTSLAEKAIAEGVEQGFLTISNALQWRLQYKRVIGLDNSQPGIKNYDKK